jgi:hypothetical protein
MARQFCGAGRNRRLRILSPAALGKVDLRSGLKEPVNLTRKTSLAATRWRASSGSISRRMTSSSGSVAMISDEDIGTNPWEPAISSFKPGEINTLIANAQYSGLSPDTLSWFPFPAGGVKGTRVVQFQQHYLALCESVGRRPKAERDKIWKVLTCLTSDQIALAEARHDVLNGMANFVPPTSSSRSA